PYLDNFVRQLNPNTTDISSTVDTNAYKAKTGYSLREGKLILGWSGSLSTAKYLHLLDEVIQEVQKSIDLKLLVIGDKDFSIPQVDVESHNWDKSIELPTIQRFDIGLYPLPDEEWVYGKSSLKAIQYMAMGIPTVGTSIGTNFRVIDDGVNGFLAKSKEEWVDRILQLARNEELRRS